MDRYFTKTFYRFFFSFLAIIATAFGVLLVTSHFLPDKSIIAAPDPNTSQ